MQNDPIFAKDVPPLQTHTCLRCGCNNKNRGGGGWGKLGKPCLFNQTQIEYPSEAVKIHNLPQYMPTSSLRRTKHSYGASVKAHILFLLINIGFFQM
jgi:hypothetical protein